MRPYELPLIEEGTAEEQLRQIKSFLYRQAENLNYNLKNSDVTSLWRQTAEALSVASNEEVEQMRRDEFQALRGLIIKSATSIIKNEDSFSAHFAGDYTAESDYGTFTEEGNIFINGNPYTIGQIYKYQAQIVTDVSKYKTDMEGFIKTGVLERGTSEPVFGMEIGYNKNAYTVGDDVYTNEAPAKIRVTPVKIGFYQGDYEVAYLEKRAIYFPAAHITGGSIKIGDNFEVTNSGNMRALNATIEGTVRARSGIIGGFETRGASSSEGRFWPCSISSILTPTDGKADDDYQYVVFIRGNYTEDGDNYGAVTTTHNVFGIKKRAENVTSWDNEVAPYVYSVTVKGEVTCASLTTDKIDGSYFKVNSDNVIIGKSGDYAKPIGIYTTGSVYIGTYAHKVDAIYLQAKSGIKIGEHNATSAVLGGGHYPSTKSVLIEASTVFQVGSSGYEVANAYFYATSTQFSGNVEPMADNGCDLGHVNFKWKNIYATTVNATTVNANYISGYVTIGKDVSDNFVGVKVGSNGHLTLCGLVGDNEYKQYSLYTIVQYMRTANATANTAKSTADTAEGKITATENTLKEVVTVVNSHAGGLTDHGNRISSAESKIYNLQTEDNKIYQRLAVIENRLGIS